LNYGENALKVAKQLFMKKGEDVKLLKVDHLTILADYFLVVSGRSDVHVKSLSDDIEKLMQEQGKTRLRIEGYRQGRWIVLDYGDMLIHIFHKNEREFYDLERLWIDGDNCIEITDDMVIA
jgi:ribosome-associated protein